MVKPLHLIALGLVSAVASTGHAAPSPADLGEAKIARACGVVERDVFHGYERVKFKFMGRDAWVAFPKDEVAYGSPWTWTMQWADAFVERTGVPYCLERGYHHVYLEAYDTKACDAAMPLFAAFQRFLVEDLGLYPRGNLLGLGWGGFYSTRYAAHYPDNVNAIFLDAPLITFQDFHEDVGPWKHEPPKDEWKDDPRMPVNLAGALARANIPVLLAYGGKDTSCPPPRGTPRRLRRPSDRRAVTLTSTPLSCARTIRTASMRATSTASSISSTTPAAASLSRTTPSGLRSATTSTSGSSSRRWACSAWSRTPSG